MATCGAARLRRLRSAATKQRLWYRTGCMDLQENWNVRAREFLPGLLPDQTATDGISAAEKVAADKEGIANDDPRVQVEKPKITQRNVQRTKPIIQEHITHVPTTVEQTVPVSNVAQNHREVPQISNTDEATPAVCIVRDKEANQDQSVREFDTISAPDLLKRIFEHVPKFMVRHWDESSKCEEVVHVPKIIPQERMQQRTEEQIVDIPVPMTQKEVVHVPKITPQECVQQQTVDQLVGVPVPMTQEEIVHLPKIIPREEKGVQTAGEETIPVSQLPDILERFEAKVRLNVEQHFSDKIERLVSELEGCRRQLGLQ